MLKRLTKQEVLDQLAAIRRMAAGDGQAGAWRVRVPRNYDKPAMDVVYGVETDGDTAFIRPVTATEDVLRKMLACLSNEEFGDMSLADVEKALAESPADKVVIGWPGGHKSCVCRILAVAQGPDCLVFFFPGPLDMDKVNEEIAEYRRAHGCPDPRLDCEGCPRLMGCEILIGAEDEVKAKRGGGTA